MLRAMNQTVRLPPTIEIRASACPHDCPSTCALEVEVLDGAHDRPRARRRGQSLHGGRDLREGRALCRAHPSSRSAAASAACARAPKGSGQFAPISWDDALDLVAEKFLAAEAKLRQRGGLALLLRRHHGPGDARRHQPPAPCEEIFRLPLHHLRQSGLDRLHRRHRQARRARSARDGEVRSAS